MSTALNEAQAEAIEVANANLNNADLPLYTDVVNMLNKLTTAIALSQPAMDNISLSDYEAACSVVAKATGAQL